MYRFQDPSSLNVQVSYGRVNIEHSNTIECTVEIKGTEDQVKEFTVRFINKEVQVIQKSTSSNNISIGNIHIGNKYVQTNGVNISQSGGGINISGVSGSVTINGKRINLSDIEGNSTSTESVDPPVITIRIPKVDCYFELSDIAELYAKTQLAEVEAELSGNAKAEVFVCDSLKADLSNTSNLKATVAEGDLDADTSGCANLKVYGNPFISTVKADSSGTSKIDTSATVKGSYKASASGRSVIEHTGTIEGRVKESVSGMARVRL